MTNAEVKLWEKRLWKARELVFSDNPIVAKWAKNEIALCQKMLSPFWQKRHDSVMNKIYENYFM